MAPLSGLTGDLQTVVTALQAIPPKIGELIQSYSPSLTTNPPSKQILAHFNSATSQLLKTSPGALLSINMNNNVSGTDTITFYDGTSASGTMLGSVSCATIQYLPLPWRFSTGLFAVTVGNADLTVSLV